MELRFHRLSNPNSRIGNPWRHLRHLRFEIGDFGQSEHTDKSRIYLVRWISEIVYTTATSSAGNKIFLTQNLHRSNASWPRPINVRMRVRRENWVCIATRTNIYFASWATKRPPIARTFIDSSRFLRTSISRLICFQVDRRDRHWGTRRISDIESAIFPSGFFRATPGIRLVEIARNSIVSDEEADELWLMAYRILPWFPDSPAALDTICYGLYARMNLLSETN